MAHSRSFLANQKARNAIFGAENLLNTNIPQEEGIETVCNAYDSLYEGESPIQTQYLKSALELILQENSFQFTEKNYLVPHGTAMGTKMAVAFANIFMGKVESQILERSAKKPVPWTQSGI